MADDKKPNGISRVPVASVNPLVSILIPCVGMLEYTKMCLPSVLRYSRQPFELIFIDIGSLDGTAEYLAGLATGLAAAGIRVERARTPTDLGIRAVCKDAFARARGEYLVLLNNDTVVSDGWLNLLTGLANVGPDIGLVGPMSNYAAAPQLVETVRYRLGPKKGPRFQEEALAGAATSEEEFDTSGVHQFARGFHQQNQGKWQHVDRLGGFCLLVKRAVLKRIGHTLEEDTGLGLFDTDILSTRARQAGFQLALCKDLFIHHFGTRTFVHGGSGEG